MVSSMQVAHDSDGATAFAAWSARQRPVSLVDVVNRDEIEYRHRLAGVIVQLRMVRGFSQATLAEKLSRSEAALSRWETAKATPSAMDLRRMALAFDLSVDQLDLLIYPPEGPISPVAIRLAAAVEAGGRAGLAAGARPRARRGAA